MIALDDRIFEAALPILDELDRVAEALAALPSDVVPAEAADIVAGMICSRIRHLRGARATLAKALSTKFPRAAQRVNAPALTRAAVPTGFTSEGTHMTVELTAETASEYDFIFLLDASGSMNTPSTVLPGATRWQEAQETIFGAAAYLEKFDADGIDVVLFGGTVELIEGVTSTKVAEIFAHRTPFGGTPLHDALALVVQKQQRSLKNTVAIVLTDGEPASKESAEAIIVDASNKLERDEQLTFLFVQVGDDAGATAYLKYLDDGLTGKAKFDIVDTVSAAEAGALDPLALINKAIND
ncbi:MAG TPA: VWA domain-containing protein [Sphingobium sp.]|uniref:VWA domain-containing protein n=1 Tax=Sphingobium sp. TaxID=1912891 RepID=UPI002ECFBB14